MSVTQHAYTTYRCDCCGAEVDQPADNPFPEPRGWGCIAIHRHALNPAADNRYWNRYHACSDCLNRADPARWVADEDTVVTADA